MRDNSPTQCLLSAKFPRHGLDTNDVQGYISKPSGEGIADIYAALKMNDSCIGRGFFADGSSGCTGKV